ncbi:hypothetical protein B0H13DRAFT_2361646 [Mycena leptocephala]|nr:hypothetical protein B0H13DRAFT_2361646 [Mycena leptocephala]
MQLLFALPLIFLSAPSSAVGRVAQASTLHAPREIPGVTTGLPLTITLSIDPSPTLTQSAVSSAYAVYADDCGPKLAQIVQDQLAVYNFEHGLSVTDINDEAFLRFLQQGAIYETASIQCQQALGQLEAQEFQATSADAPPTSSTDTSTSTETGARSESAKVTASATTSSTDTSTSTETGARSEPAKVTPSATTSGSGSGSGPSSSTASQSAPSGAATQQSPPFALALAGMLIVHLWG